MYSYEVEGRYGMGDYYKLEGKEVIPCDIDGFTEMYGERQQDRIIAQEHVTTPNEEVFVSTVFLGMDHGFGLTDIPLLFETMVFGEGVGCEIQERYSTYQEAEEGHKAMCERMTTQ